VRTEIFNGFIFVNLDPDAAPMDTWYPGVREELSAYVPQIDSLAAARMDRDPGELQLEGLGRELFGVLSLLDQPPDIRDRGDQAETYDIQPQKGYVLRHTTECSNLERMSYPIDLDSNEHATNTGAGFSGRCSPSRSIPATC
jgi:hypothetical protein